MDQEWREILLMQPKFGEHARLVFEYCELFGVNPLAVKTKKLLRLLKDVSIFFESKRFSYQKREYEVSIPVVVTALRTVCNKHFEQPLENQNYLKRVMMTLAEREQKAAMDAADRAQRAREESGIRRSGEPEIEQPAPDAVAAKARVKENVGKILKRLEGDRSERAPVDPEERRRELKRQAESLKGEVK